MHIDTLINEGVVDFTGYIQTNACNCPSCGAPANYRFFDSCNAGCINQQKATECPSCGYHSCDDEGCMFCETKYREEFANISANILGIKCPVSAYLFLANVETKLMVILAQSKLLNQFFNLTDSNYQDVVYKLTEESHSLCDDLYEFDRTNFANLKFSQEIKQSIYSLFSKIDENLGWADSY